MERAEEGICVLVVQLGRDYGAHFVVTRGMWGAVGVVKAAQAAAAAEGGEEAAIVGFCF